MSISNSSTSVHLGRFSLHRPLASAEVFSRLLVSYRRSRRASRVRGLVEYYLLAREVGAGYKRSQLLYRFKRTLLLRISDNELRATSLLPFPSINPPRTASRDPPELV